MNLEMLILAQMGFPQTLKKVSWNSSPLEKFWGSKNDTRYVSSVNIVGKKFKDCDECVVARQNVYLGPKIP